MRRNAGFTAAGAADPRARHRRDDRRVFGRLRRPAAAAAVSRGRPARATVGRASRRGLAAARADAEQPDLLRLGRGAAHDRAARRRQRTAATTKRRAARWRRRRSTTARVTPSLFAMLGAAPALGRFFSSETKTKAGSDHVAVLSDRAWRERFNADPSIVGRGLMVGDAACTIVGVAKPGFYFPDRETLLWMPLVVRPPSPDAVAGQRGRMAVLNALARLKPGVTPAAGRSRRHGRRAHDRSSNGRQPALRRRRTARLSTSAASSTR